MMATVKIMADRRPLASMNHNTGTTGMMYMMFPQLPNNAIVAGVHSGQKTAKSDSEIGPKLFQIIP
jgi:hypothetical protein